MRVFDVPQLRLLHTEQDESHIVEVVPLHVGRLANRILGLAGK